MPFQKGNKLSQGRKPDTLSKRSLRFADAIMDSGVDLVAELLGALNNAKQMYAKTDEPALKATFNGQIITTAEKMLPYLYPKLSSIEVKPNNPLANMSPQERLEAMRLAVQALEQELNPLELSSAAEPQTVNLDVPGSIPGVPAK